MDGAAGEERMPTMTMPIVTELPRVLEPTTADTFIAGDTPVVPAPAVRSRRIVD
jgi:hypothetical protein